MTTTHISHFGLDILNESETSAVLSGSLSNCKRMAAAHGMEIDRYEGRTVGMDGTTSIKSPPPEDCPEWIFFKGGGLISKTRDSYCLVIPSSIWRNAV